MAAQEAVFVALHPPAIADALASVRPHLDPRGIVVSLAPKVTLASLEAGAAHPRVVRMIPNAPSIIGRGYNPVTFATSIDDPTRGQLRILFKPWGQAPEVPEPTLEGYAILTGMGPTYFWPQWQVLRELAGGMGLGATECDVALQAMISGSLATLLDSGLAPAAVMDLVPVKPLAAAEASMITAYRESLTTLYAKIQPAQPSPAVRTV